MAQVEGVADQLCPGGGGDAQPEGEGLGGERGHRGGAVPAERLLPGQHVERGAAVGGDPGLTRGGVQDRPLVGQPELHQGGAAFCLLGLGGGFEDTGSIEVLDLELLDRCRAHRTIQAATTDRSPHWSRIALFHRGLQKLWGWGCLSLTGFRGSGREAAFAPQPTNGAGRLTPNSACVTFRTVRYGGFDSHSFDAQGRRVWQIGMPP